MIIAPTRQDGIGILRLLAIGAAVVATSSAIGWLAKGGHLLAGAAPLGIALVVSVAWLPPRWQAGAWAAMTLWLLPLVYAVTGDAIEYVALVVVIAGTLLGLFRSPWFLAGVWFFHPAWDLLPRTLPAAMHDLPLSCVIYDLIVACYLSWASARGRLVVLGRSASPTWAQAGRAIGLAAAVTALIGVQVATVRWALSANLMLAVAAPTGVAMLLGMAWMPERPRAIALAVLTAWAGMTFAHSGHPVEIAVFFAIMAVAYLGAERDPAYFVGAWGFLTAWSLLPLPWHMMRGFGMGHVSLPGASAVYDGVIFAGVAAHWLRHRAQHRAPSTVGSTPDAAVS